MLRPILFILTIMSGIIVLIIGYKQIKDRSTKENILDVILSIFLGDFDTTGIGTFLIGLALIIFGIMGIALGW